MPLLLRQTLICIAVVALQWLVLGRLSIAGAYPDVVLLYLTVLALRHGRMHGMLAGFFMGFALDALYGLWGIHMFVKTLVGFLIGLFPVGERTTLTIMPQQAFIGGFVVALLHNGLLVIFLVLLAHTRNTYMISVLWIGSALYTALVGTVMSLFSSRR
jgi:rod shape-determining protein MreD